MAIYDFKVIKLSSTGTPSWWFAENYLNSFRLVNGLSTFMCETKYRPNVRLDFQDVVGIFNSCEADLKFSFINVPN